ncbi:MAG TPA: ABC transporter substrate-binding protein [Acidocella sp.]|uniref:ABC transporter substrate-binding protein n=1 Tax=Acidocella sp. TaxID=50710 RepID=UPI002BC74AAA|nr:ABC transporter substrate-binding protein [Acidocella sp.]HVE20445.1 ABC transporter substrate-binding protein [Acidocella sp.]
MRNILLATAAFVALGCAATASAQAQIKIGVAGPLTGSNAAFGEQLKTGADLAIADINAAGGINGQKLKEIAVDDACDPKTAVSAANTLVSDGVVMVDGHFCSASSIPASKVYSDNGIIEISPGSTNPKYTDEGSPFIFRTCGRDDEQGKVAAVYISEHFKNAKIAVLDDNSTYGKGIADQVRANLGKLGVPVAYNTSYTAGDKDYSALISRLKQQGITLVYLGGYYSDTGLIMREGAAQGFTPQYFSEDAAVTSALWQIAGPAAEGTLMTFSPPAEKDPAAAKAVAELTKLHEDPTGYVLYSYAAIQVWAEAAKRAGTTSPSVVAKTLKQDGPWQTVLGPLSFDSKGDVVNAAYAIWKWHDGQYSVFAMH